VSKAMKDYTDLLPQTIFFRPHHSFVVNRLFVTRYDKSGILHLKNGAEIPVAVRKREEVLELILGNKSGGL
jgi:two-component system LytT family response regulator